MKLSQAIQFFDGLKSESNNTSEIKVYEKFTHMLTQLNQRSFSAHEIQAIESKLDELQLHANHKKKRKHFSKALKQFEDFINTTFQLTPKGHYTQLGSALGTSFGLLFGVVVLSSLERSLGISLGSGLGLLIGFFIGQNMDATALAENRVL